MDSATPQRHIIVVALITAFCLLGDSMLYIVLPMHYADAGLSSLWEVGVILSVNRIVRLPLNPCIGFIYRRISERTGIIIAVILAVLTTVMYGFADSFMVWLLARVLWGLAWTLLRLGSLFYILRISSASNRGHLNGLYNGLYRLGSLVGMLAGGILADMTDFATTSYLFGLITAVAIIPSFFAIPRDVGGQQSYSTSFAEGLRVMRISRLAFILVMTGGIVAFVTQGVIASTLSPLIALHAGDVFVFFGFGVGAATLAGFFQALRFGWEPWLAPCIGILADRRFGWVFMLRWSLFIAAVFFLLLALPLPLVFWFACVIGAQLMATSLTTLSEAAASSTAASDGGRALLMQYALVVDLGAAAGPLVAYGVIALFDVNAVYVVSGVLFLLTFFFWYNAPKPS